MSSAPSTRPRSLPAAAAAPRPARARTKLFQRRRVVLAWLWGLPAIGLASTTANPSLSMVAVASLLVCVICLWRTGVPPVMLFVAFFQWLQGALKIMQANLLGVDIATLTYSHHIEDAAYLTLIWVAALAIGSWTVLRWIGDDQIARAEDQRLSLRGLFIVYAVFSVTLQVVAAIAPASARQVVNAFDLLRWSIVFALFISAAGHPRGRLLVVALLLLEVGIGFLSFFSSFKTPLIVLVLALATAGYRPTARQYVALAMVGAITLYLGILWSAVKMEYRDRISGGSGQQTVSIGLEDQVHAFTDLVGTADSDVLSRGVDRLVDRLAYIEYFSYTIDYVPGVRPHEDGRLWRAAAEHIITPRVFFPDKSALETDTVVAERYTGLQLQGERETSIALGLPAETYVDFGDRWMFAVALALGVLYAFTFRFFITRKEAGAIAQGFAVATHQALATIETGAIKTLGGHLSLFLIAVVIWYAAVPRLMRYLRKT